jgi:hypothetical protein
MNNEQNQNEDINLVSPVAYEMAKANARYGLYAACLSSLLLLSAILGFSYFVSVRNEVVMIPSGELYEYPLVEKVYVSSPHEENRKLVSVAMKYIKSMYEINAADFSKIKTDDGSFSISSKAADMLNYVPVGLKEYNKVLFAIKQSQYNYEQFNECQCRIKFFAEEVRVKDIPGTPFKRVEVLGFFENLSRDTRRPMPAEYAGHKLISLMMVYESEVYDSAQTSATVYDTKKENNVSNSSFKDAGIEVVSRGKTSVQADLKLDALPKNPEGWFIVRSNMDDLSTNDRIKYQNMRLDSGLKEAY